MDVRFEENGAISAENPLVKIEAESLSGKAKQVYDAVVSLENQYISIKVDEKIVLLKIEEIILADIQKTSLLIYCQDGIYQTKEALRHFQNRLARTNFIQVSKHAIINIDHLESLADSFSGTMTAKLSRGVKTSVSRRYVKSLRTYLGI